MLEGKLINSFRQPGGQLKWAEWQPKRKTQLTPSQGMLKRWYVADEDDEVRTTIATDPCGNKWVLKNLSFEPSVNSQTWPPKPLPRSSRKGGVWFSPHTSLWRGGGGTGNRQSLQEFRSSARPSDMIISKQGFQLFFDCRRWIKPNFLFPVILAMQNLKDSQEWHCRNCSVRNLTTGKNHLVKPWRQAKT